MFPQLLRDYRLELANPDREWGTRSTWFNRQIGLDCKLIRR